MNQCPMAVAQPSPRVHGNLSQQLVIGSLDIGHSGRRSRAGLQEVEQEEAEKGPAYQELGTGRQGGGRERGVFFSSP
jgi:hypothetical protein